MKLVQKMVLPLAAIFLLASTFAPMAGASLKCRELLQVPGLEPDEPLVLVDGKIRESGLTAIEDLDVASIEILCWNPETKTFSELVGVGVVSVLTKPFIAAVRDQLAQVLEVQDAYFARNSRAWRSVR